MWHNISKESHKKEGEEEDLLTMTGELKEHVREATKARVKLKESSEEWLAITSEAEVILEAKKAERQ